MKLTGISLFSNCGAGDVGFRRAGFEFQIMAELEPGRLAIALRNHPGAEGVGGDLRNTWPQVVKNWRGRFGEKRPDLLAACPPCQGMSSARSDRGSEADPIAGSRDERNLLVMPIAEIARRLLPSLVVVENVPAFLRRKVRDPRSGDGISAAKLLATMLDDHYWVSPVVVDLADYGVPQTRKRAFLTFIRRDLEAVRVLGEHHMAPYPTPTHAGDHGGRRISLGEAIAEFRLPALDAATPEAAGYPNEPMHHVPVWSERQYAMVEAIPAGSGASAWQNDRCRECGPVEVADDDARCPVCESPLLRPVVEERSGLRLVKGFRRSSYRRMAPDVPAATITTASGRVGSSRTIHPFENRVFSPLECALLQTIPRDFDWGDALRDSGVMEVRAMIGEAVPPRFTCKHGEVLRDLLAGRMPRLLGADDRRCRQARSKLSLDAE